MTATTSPPNSRKPPVGDHRPHHRSARPIAGALRLVEASTSGPRSVDVSDYAWQMNVCGPYLAPSLQQGLTTWPVYRADGDAEAVQA
ncbi:hypothetical protein AB0O51_36990 [Streptomyces sp. NPDC090301]|uniref:hypothetical protein n=1 Tax=Streptomyces sp. NPDC090301 TaxID=3154975 RepID=UPI0034424BDB